jgi:mRNA-degrading endonuclease RelE of RelBE toxin-antitoxin system
MAIVELSDAAVEDYREVPLGMKLRIADVIERLEKWPAVSGAKPLTRELKGHYRIRAGDWRVVFHVAGEIVTIDRIDNRKDVYQ